MQACLFVSIKALSSNSVTEIMLHISQHNSPSNWGTNLHIHLRYIHILKRQIKSFTILIIFSWLFVCSTLLFHILLLFPFCLSLLHTCIIHTYTTFTTLKIYKALFQFDQSAVHMFSLSFSLSFSCR